MREWLIGSDPEFFLATADGQFVNAFDGFATGVIAGTKKAPEKTSYGAIQVDGMAIELNTKPTADPEQFSRMLQAGLADAMARFKARVNEGSVQAFDMDYLCEQAPEAIDLGCDPDFNAWRGGEANPRPEVLTPYRTAGGHIHVGWNLGDMMAYSKPHWDECCSMVRHLDYALGLWSLPLDTKGALRRKLYGNAGAFRPKPYGVEYRVLSNFWLMKPALQKEVATRTLLAMRAYDDGKNFADIYGHAVTDMLCGLVGPNEAMLGEINETLKLYA